MVEYRAVSMLKLVPVSALDLGDGPQDGNSPVVDYDDTHALYPPPHYLCSRLCGIRALPVDSTQTPIL